MPKLENHFEWLLLCLSFNICFVYWNNSTTQYNDLKYSENKIVNNRQSEDVQKISEVINNWKRYSWIKPDIHHNIYGRLDREIRLPGCTLFMACWLKIQACIKTKQKKNLFFSLHSQRVFFLHTLSLDYNPHVRNRIMEFIIILFQHHYQQHIKLILFKNLLLLSSAPSRIVSRIKFDFREMFLAKRRRCLQTTLGWNMKKEAHKWVRN